MDEKCVPTATQRSDPLAAIIVPAQHLIDGAGAADVFRQEIATFRELRWRVLLVVVAPSLKVRTSSRRLWLAGVIGAAQQLGADEIRVLQEVRPLRAQSAVMRLIFARLVGRWDIETDLEVSDLVDVGTIGGIETPSAVVCNYLSSTAAADALAPRSRQILVLHDVPPRRLSTRVAQRLVGRPHIVTLTREDAQRLKTSTGASCEVGVPFEKSRTLTFDDILKYRRLGDLVDASGPAQTPQNGWARSPAALGPSLDLLFVGGTHQPNVEGLAAFVEECFLPHLVSSGVRLVVAGEVGPALWGRRQPPGGVVALGRVADLRPLYAAAKLVIVPLLSGTGISLKTLEALSFGKPVLSSPVGLRGICHRLAVTAEPPFDERWGKRIASLLESRAERRRLRDELCGSVSETRLDSTLEALVRRVSENEEISGCRRSAPPPPVSGDTPLVEWFADLPELLSVAKAGASTPADLAFRLAEALEARGYGSANDCLDLACDLCKAAEQPGF